MPLLLPTEAFDRLRFALRRYGLAGFQWMYLRLKSFQRFTETWALLERCAAAGLFQPRGEGGIFAPTAPGEGRPLRVVSPTDLKIAACQIHRLLQT